MEPADVAEAQRVLHELITRVERGELDAPALLLARLTGARDALDAITDPSATHGDAEA